MWPIAQCNTYSTNFLAKEKFKIRTCVNFSFEKGCLHRKKNLDEKIHKSQISVNHKYFIEGFK